MASEIKDINLAESGLRKIEWVRRNCPLLSMLHDEFEKTKPFAGKKIALSVHLEAKTAYLCLTLKAGGAEMYVTGSNPLSTQDDVAAALVHEGLEVHAWHGTTDEEYNNHIRAVLSPGPDIIIDDGGDLVHVFLDDRGGRNVALLAAFASLEVDVGVLRRHAPEGILDDDRGVLSIAHQS